MPIDHEVKLRTLGLYRMGAAAGGGAAFTIASGNYSVPAVVNSALVLGLFTGAATKVLISVDPVMQRHVSSVRSWSRSSHSTTIRNLREASSYCSPWDSP